MNTICLRCKWYAGCIHSEDGMDSCLDFEDDGSYGVEGDEDYENDWEVPGSEIDEYETTGAGDQ